MANSLKKVLVWSEATPNTIPTSPTCYSMKVESFGISATQNSEVNNELGNGRGASQKVYGSISVGGDLGVIWNTDNAPFLMKHGVGNATSTVNATSDSWSATTAFTIGDLANHTNGTHTLVCRGSGTSGSTVPSVTGGRGSRVTDGTVTWIVMPLLKEQNGVRGECIASFGVEVRDDESCGASDPQYTRSTGMYISSLPMTISGGMNALKTSVSTTGMFEEDSVIVTDQGGTYQPMSDKAGFTETEMLSDYFSLDDCTFYINGSQASVKTTSFDATINNNVSIEDALNSQKIESIGIVEISGNLGIIMDKAMYADAAAHETASAKVVFQKANGCLLELEFPQFKLEKTVKTFDSAKTTMLTIPFSAFDTATEYSVKWRTISPISA